MCAASRSNENITLLQETSWRLVPWFFNFAPNLLQFFSDFFKNPANYQTTIKQKPKQMCPWTQPQLIRERPDDSVPVNLHAGVDILTSHFLPAGWPGNTQKRATLTLIAISRASVSVNNVTGIFTRHHGKSSGKSCFEPLCIVDFTLMSIFVWQPCESLMWK